MPQQTNLNPRPRTWRAVPAASFISIERKLPTLRWILWSINRKFEEECPICHGQKRNKDAATACKK